MKKYTLKETGIFRKWAAKLDVNIRTRIYSRVDRACATGHFGDHQGIGAGLSEMRFDFGHGYRVYYTIWRNVVLLLLLGGDKSGQQADIERAKAMLPLAVAALKKEMGE